MAEEVTGWLNAGFETEWNAGLFCRAFMAPILDPDFPWRDLTKPKYINGQKDPFRFDKPLPAGLITKL